MSEGLISVGCLLQAGLEEEILHAKEVGEMYPLETVMEAHARMGHISPAAIRRLVRDGMMVGMEVDLNTPSGRSTPRTSVPWDLVWSDVWGPPDTEAKGGLCARNPRYQRSTEPSHLGSERSLGPKLKL